MISRFAGRYGQRGAWLILMGGVYVVFGIGVYLDPVAPRGWVLYEYLPVWAQAALFWATGAVAIRQGLRGRHHDDTLGHVALYLAPAVRVISFALAWVVYVGSEAAQAVGFDNEVIGYKQGWYAALVWLIISAMLGLAASWPNPDQPLPHPPVDARDGA